MSGRLNNETPGARAASVQFDAVSKAFGDVVAVNDVSFTIAAGELVTLLGPSGCGKTTTLRMIAGLEMATGGRILIGDEEVTGLPATERDVCMVFQSYALFPHMSVLDNVAYGFVVTGMAKAEAHERARKGMELVGLPGFGERFPSELSGGQQQRVAVARALVLEPQVLLFDEPLSNLDAKLRRRVREEIREIQQQLGLTVAYVTHDQEEALAVSDRIIVMRNAEIAQVGTPHELYEQPSDRFVADFIGDANLIDAQVLEVTGDTATVDVGGIRMELASRGISTGSASVAVRPGTIRVAPATAGQSAPLVGQIAKATYLGNHMEYTVETAVGELFVVDYSSARPLAMGTSVTVDLGSHVALVAGGETA